MSPLLLFSTSPIWTRNFVLHPVHRITHGFFSSTSTAHLNPLGGLMFALLLRRPPAGGLALLLRPLILSPSIPIFLSEIWDKDIQVSPLHLNRFLGRTGEMQNFESLCLRPYCTLTFIHIFFTFIFLFLHFFIKKISTIQLYTSI
jgi:hypothetical protein